MRFYEWSQAAYLEAKEQRIPNWSVREPEFRGGLHFWDVLQGHRVAVWNAETVALFDENVEPTDFPFADSLIPIVSSRLKTLLDDLQMKNIQYLPLSLRGQRSGREMRGYFIANYLSVIDCLNRERSVYRLWTKENLTFPEKRPWMLGTFEHVQRAVLDQGKVDGASLFRLWGWNMVVVREDIKQAIESSHIIGCRFTELDTS